jgi:hypothetical protein
MPADQRTPEREERFMDVGALVVPHTQTAKLVQPRERPLHDPTPPPHAAAMLRAGHGQQWENVVARRLCRSTSASYARSPSMQSGRHRDRPRSPWEVAHPEWAQGREEGAKQPARDLEQVYSAGRPSGHVASHPTNKPPMSYGRSGRFCRLGSPRFDWRAGPDATFLCGGMRLRSGIRGFILSRHRQ